MIQGLGHITFSVSNMERSVPFYSSLLGVSPIVLGEKTTYFEVGGIWIALNLQADIKRDEIYDSYSHVSFSMKPEDMDQMHDTFNSLQANVVPGRSRDPSSEGESIYVRDPDGHLIEFHTGSLTQRLEHLKKTNPSLLIKDSST
ncbi:VOC family protein [Alkalihalobacillus sp. FSL R5-0424]